MMSNSTNSGFFPGAFKTTLINARIGSRKEIIFTPHIDKEKLLIP
jgi:hypothetical protein